MLAPDGLHLFYLQIGRLLLQLRLVAQQGRLEVEGIDQIEHVALVDILVVANPQFRDLARNLRRHARDLHAHPAVPGPWRANVIVPDHEGHENGDERDGQRRKPSRQA